eukprot:751235-Hanusia_phi.AAC.3
MGGHGDRPVAIPTYTGGPAQARSAHALTVAAWLGGPDRTELSFAAVGLVTASQVAADSGMGAGESLLCGDEVRKEEAKEAEEEEERNKKENAVVQEEEERRRRRKKKKKRRKRKRSPGRQENEDSKEEDEDSK